MGFTPTYRNDQGGLKSYVRMKPFLTFLMFTISSVLAEELQVRVTYYDAESCVFGSQTATGRRAVEGVTVAVDPKVIPYGSVIEIDELRGVLGEGRFVAHDTGSAVKSRRASKAHGRNLPVVDVFVKTRRRMNHLAMSLPMFMKVRYFDPSKEPVEHTLSQVLNPVHTLAKLSPLANSSEWLRLGTVPRMVTYLLADFDRESLSHKRAQL